MNIQKKAVSGLLLSVFFISLAMGLVFTGAVYLYENRFYNHKATEKLIRDTAADAKIAGSVLSNLQFVFSSVLENPAVKRSFLPFQTTAEIFGRSVIFGSLRELVTGLISVRLADSDGRVLFSSNEDDVVYADGNYIVYRDYDEDQTGPAFSEVKLSDGENIKLTADMESNLLIYSLPLYDSEDLVRGTALFAVSAEAVMEDISVVANPSGIINGLPKIFRDEIISEISSVWAEAYRSIVRLESGGTPLTLVSARTDYDFYYGQVVSASFHALASSKKIIIFISLYIILFLTILIIFYFRRKKTFVLNNGMSVDENFRQGLSFAVDDTKPVNDIIMERDGIHFINNNAVNSDSNRSEKLNSDFRDLVEAVVSNNDASDASATSDAGPEL